MPSPALELLMIGGSAAFFWALLLAVLLALEAKASHVFLLESPQGCLLVAAASGAVALAALLWYLGL